MHGRATSAFVGGSVRSFVLEVAGLMELTSRGLLACHPVPLEVARWYMTVPGR